MNTPPFNWTPPEWKSDKPEDKPDLTKDPNSQATAPVFNKPDLPRDPAGNPKLNGGITVGLINMQARVNALIANTTTNNTHFVANRGVEDPEGSDAGVTLTQVPHPRSDFRHVDPGFNGAPFQAAIANLRGLKGPGSLDGQVDDTLKKTLPLLDDLDAMLGPNSRGMQRLKLVSDHALVRIITILGEINVALAKPGNAGRVEYNAVREEYIELLKDLDDREPNVVSPGKSGYGRSLQWFYVRPIIHAGRIKGAVVQAKWNPHVSSSGVPIPHS
jgi:hypothetical protein